MGWFSGRLVRQDESRPVVVGWARAREVFPPEPPVAIAIRPERRATVKGVAHLGGANCPGNSDLVDGLAVEPHPFLHPSFYISSHSGSSA
jgi:hypothetical protein